MISNYLKKLILKIGVARVMAFIVLLIISYAVYFLQPYLINQLFAQKQTQTNRVIVLLLLAISLMMMPLINCLNNGFIQAVRKYSKQELWADITKKPLSYFARQSVGKVQSYIKDVSFACRELEQTSLAVVIQMAVMLLLYTILLSLQNIWLGLAYLLFFIGYLLVSIMMARKNRQNVASSLSSASKVNEYIVDYYRNVETIMSSDAAKYEQDKMDKILAHEQSSFIKVQAITNKAALLQQLMIVVLACVIAGISQFLLGTHDSQSLSIVLILLYSILNLSGFGTQYLAIEELLNRIRAGLAELEYGKVEKVPLTCFDLDGSKQEIIINGISYSYHGQHPVLSNLKLNFKKGEMSALIGPNGAGKSTLLKIISGFYQPDKGQIILPFSDRPTIMYVAQDASLFNRSLMANICYPDHQVDLQKIYGLVQEIGLDSLIKSPTDLIDKTPGDFKNKISGGEEQKILFLRAIITKPQILLLDEFTSNLDEKSIATVYKMLKQYLPKSTIISVIHRTAELRYYKHVVEL